MKNLIPSNFSELESQIREAYDEIWRDGFPAACAKAKLEIVETTDDATAKYFDDDRIQIPLLSADIADYLGKAELMKIGFVSKEELDWKLWKASLVHEMLHEYEAKCVPTATEEGILLRKKLAGLGLLFQPIDRHHDKFYSAICEKACFFNMTALEFAEKIK